MQPKVAEFLVNANVHKILKGRYDVHDFSPVKIEVVLGGKEFKIGSKSERPFVFKSNLGEREIFVG